MLVVEGQSVFSGPVANDGIRGLLLAVADLGVTIIHAEDARDTAAWLHRLATRRRDGAVRNRPVYAQREKSLATSPAESAVASATGVSVVTARTVLERFGSLRNLCDADISELQGLPGIGRKRAEAILRMIHEPWSATRPL